MLYIPNAQISGSIRYRWIPTFYVLTIFKYFVYSWIGMHLFSRLLHILLLISDDNVIDKIVVMLTSFLYFRTFVPKKEYCYQIFGHEIHRLDYNWNVGFFIKRNLLGNSIHFLFLFCFKILSANDFFTPFSGKYSYRFNLRKLTLHSL